MAVSRYTREQESRKTVSWIPHPVLQVIDLYERAHLTDFISEVQVSILLPGVRAVSIPCFDMSTKKIRSHRNTSRKVVTVIAAETSIQSST